VVISGLRQLVREGQVGEDEVVVAFITGAGLKTQEAVAPALQPPLAVQATIESFERELEARDGSLPLAKAV
jgi:threonine synthase